MVVVVAKAAARVAEVPVAVVAATAVVAIAVVVVAPVLASSGSSSGRQHCPLYECERRKLTVVAGAFCYG